MNINKSQKLGRILSGSCKRLFVKNRRCISNSSERFLDPEEYQQMHLFGYNIKKITELPEYKALAVELVHEKSGAQHLHIARDDQNNVFSVAFRTIPMDSTGVPHILEHTVLCGSKSFPVRDPFFKMLNRSLSTFMNAMTASDWTIYPFSTQNVKDYENLMSVYLDATFFPNLNEVDFRQEGWRLEHTDPHDNKSDIIFKGVVFNEMKGVFANQESLYSSKHQSLLLPSHTYGNESGGEPLHIPNLTWQQLKDFHTTGYHPSNSIFFTYGNFPLDKTLEQIHSTLQHFDKIDISTNIPEESKWTESRLHTMSCQPDQLAPDPEKQCTVSVSYMLDAINDPFQSFTMGILSTLLVSGPNSPFFQSLIEPNIGSEYSPVTGIDSSTKNPGFGIGLQGLHESDLQKVQDIIQETFQNVYINGFDDERIESILHSAELAKKHQTSNFGLNLSIGLASYWTHGNNPVDFLLFDKQVRCFRETIAENPSFLREKVKEFFLDNPHKLTLIMKPDENFTAEKELEEQKLLEKNLSTLTPEDKEKIYHDGVDLDAKQNDVEDMSCLPKMQVSDVSKYLIPTILNKHLEDSNVEVYTSEQPTNGITYFQSVATTSSLPFMLKPYLPLFCKVLTKLGAGSRNHKDLAQAIEMTTSGLAARTHITSHHTDEDQFELGISLSSYCLKQNIPNMFSLWQDVLNEPRLFERDYLLTLVNSYASDLAMSIAGSGHAYAMATASRNLSKYAQVSELLGGMSQVEFMRELAEKAELDEIIQNLMKIAMYMLNANEMRCLINTTAEQMDFSVNSLEAMLNTLNTVGFEDEEYIDSHFVAKPKNTFIPMDFPVNYVSKCLPGVPFTHPDHSRLQILAKVMSAKYLHREIREKGGAYGSGAKHSGGIFSFFSYRDPNVITTLDAFDGATKWASEGRFTDDDLEEAKLSTFSAIDSPVAPGYRGVKLFNSGLSDEIRQTNRDRLFAMNKDDLVSVCQKYLLSGHQIESKAVIGPKIDNLYDDGTWDVPLNMQGH